MSRNTRLKTAVVAVTSVQPTSARRTTRQEGFSSDAPHAGATPAPTIASSKTSSDSGHARKTRHALEIIELLVVADVLTSRITQRLVVPRLIATLPQCRIHEVTSLLTRQHRLVDLGQVP